jgi:prepilin-type N-terminal cleavage/methylation domain-containing protein
MPRRGLTLLELLLVLSILVALATLIVPNISFVGSQSQAVSTRENLQRLQELLVNRYIPDMGGSGYQTPPGASATNPYAGTNFGNMVANLPAPGAQGYSTRSTFHPQLRYLFVNPDDVQYPETMTWTGGLNALSTRRWQGPYVQLTGSTYQVTDTGDGGTGGTNGSVSSGFTSVYGLNGDPTVLDAWGRPIVIQTPTAADPTTGEPGANFARLVSAGPNGILDTPENATMPTKAQRGDDVILFLFHADANGQGVPTLGP